MIIFLFTLLSLFMIIASFYAGRESVFDEIEARRELKEYIKKIIKDEKTLI